MLNTLTISVWSDYINMFKYGHNHMRKVETLIKPGAIIRNIPLTSKLLQSILKEKCTISTFL